MVKEIEEEKLEKFLPLGLTCEILRHFVESVVYEFITEEDARNDPKYEAAREDERFEMLVEWALSGDYESMGALAQLLQDKGYEEEAGNYINCLIASDTIEAKNGLAWTYYFKGPDNKPNFTEALKLLEEVMTEHPNPDERYQAAWALFDEYYTGLHVKRDWRKALACATVMMQNRDVPFEEMPHYKILIGDIYAIGGHGVKRDKKKAKAWFTKAKSSGNSTLKNLAKMALEALKNGIYSTTGSRICFGENNTNWSDSPLPPSMKLI